MAERREKAEKNLGRTQVLVLRLLAEDHKSPAHLAYDWPSLTESAARSAVERLGQRGLVDVAGFDDGQRTYKLTELGREVELSLLGDLDAEATNAD